MSFNVESLADTVAIARVPFPCDLDSAASSG